MSIVRHPPAASTGPSTPASRHDRITLTGTGKVGTKVIASYPEGAIGQIGLIKIGLNAPYTVTTLLTVNNTNSIDYTVTAGDVGSRIAVRVASVQYIDPEATIPATA